MFAHHNSREAGDCGNVRFVRVMVQATAFSIVKVDFKQHHIS